MDQLARVCRGGMCTGWGQWVDRPRRPYARQRRTGGKPIADYQAVQNMLARMDMDVYQARATSLIAQSRLDQLGLFDIRPHPTCRLVSLLK